MAPPGFSALGMGVPEAQSSRVSALIVLATAAGAVDAGGAGVSAPMSATLCELAAYSAPLPSRVEFGAFARRVRAHNRCSETVLRMNGIDLARGVEWRFACKPTARATDGPMSAYTREPAASRQHATAGTAAACSTRWRAMLAPEPCPQSHADGRGLIWLGRGVTRKRPQRREANLPPHAADFFATRRDRRVGDGRGPGFRGGACGQPKSPVFAWRGLDWPAAGPLSLLIGSGTDGTDLTDAVGP